MKKITRQKILEASIDVIKKYGYEKFSVRNIAKQLGCSTQPIYSEFGDKQELEKAVYQESQKHHKKYAEQFANGGVKFDIKQFVDSDFLKGFLPDKFLLIGKDDILKILKD